MKASVISTFLNEETTIRDFLEGLLGQTTIPDEIILCDGGSDDGTLIIVSEYIEKGVPVKLITKKGNRSVGRNEAIRQARNDVIVVTDAGTVADKNWYEQITKPFEDSKVQTVAGFFKADPKTFFEKVSSTLMLADHDNIDIESWLPSTRSIAFRKEAWEKVGGFPEHTRYNEDTPFDLALKKAGYRFVFVPNAYVFWRPRSNLKSFFKQYHDYSIGDGLDLIHLKHYLRKSLTYLFGFLLLLASVKWKFLLLPLVLGFGVYLFRKDIRVIKKIPDFRTILLAPVLTFTYDLAEISGYLKGIFKRISNKY